MEIVLTDYQKNRLMYEKEHSIYRGLSLPDFIGVVLTDWLNGGLVADH